MVPEWQPPTLNGQVLGMVVTTPLPWGVAVGDSWGVHETWFNEDGTVTRVFRPRSSGSMLDATVPEWQENRRKFFTATPPL